MKFLLTVLLVLLTSSFSFAGGSLWVNCEVTKLNPSHASELKLLFPGSLKEVSFSESGSESTRTIYLSDLKNGTKTLTEGRGNTSIRVEPSLIHSLMVNFSTSVRDERHEAKTGKKARRANYRLTFENYKEDEADGALSVFTSNRRYEGVAKLICKSEK